MIGQRRAFDAPADATSATQSCSGRDSQEAPTAIIFISVKIHTRRPVPEPSAPTGVEN